MVGMIGVLVAGMRGVVRLSVTARMFLRAVPVLRVRMMLVLLLYTAAIARAGLGLKFLAAMLAAEVMSEPVALGVQGGRRIHRHAADGILHHLGRVLI